MINLKFKNLIMNFKSVKNLIPSVSTFSTYRNNAGYSIEN